MKNKLISIFTVLLILPTCFVSTIQAQIWPGDVTDNGIVNHVDFLYLGEAFFESGPPRLPSEMGFDWAEKIAGDPWGTTFPVTGVDYSYADCDGDGLVTTIDILAIEENFGLTHGAVVDDVFEVGTSGTDPEIFFDQTGITEPFLEGSVFPLAIHLGMEDQTIIDFNGIGFTVEYDPNVINSAGFEFFFESSWINPSGNDILRLMRNDPVNGVLTIAATRAFGSGPVSGSGPIGVLLIIIEDDVVGLSEPSIESLLEINQVILTNSDLTTQPVVNDTLMLTIIPDDITLSQEELDINQQIVVFPNPVQDELHIQAKGAEKINGVQFFNTVGQEVLNQSFSARSTLDLNTQNLPDGIYFVQMQLDDRMVSKKIMINRN